LNLLLAPCRSDQGSVGGDQHGLVPGSEAAETKLQRNELERVGEIEPVRLHQLRRVPEDDGMFELWLVDRDAPLANVGQQLVARP
jgi:hypothetical protein